MVSDTWFLKSTKTGEIQATSLMGLSFEARYHHKLSSGYLQNSLSFLCRWLAGIFHMRDIYVLVFHSRQPLMPSTVRRWVLLVIWVIVFCSIMFSSSHVDLEIVLFTRCESYRKGRNLSWYSPFIFGDRLPITILLKYENCGSHCWWFGLGAAVPLLCLWYSSSM